MQCKNCGAELRENAKFCIRCGRPVDLAPSPEPSKIEDVHDEGPERLKAEFEEAPSAFAPKETPDPFEEGTPGEGDCQDGPHQQIRVMVTRTMTHPFELCKEFRKEEYRRSNLLILLIKDVILAFFTAITMARVNYGSDAVLGNAMKFLGVDPVGIFFKFLVFMILFDAASIFAYFFAAKIFGSPISLYEWTGVIASVAFWSVLGSGVSLILGIVRLGFLGSLFSGFAMLVSAFTILKAYMSMTDLEESRQIYSLVVATLFIGIFIFILILIFTFMVASSAMGGIRNMYDPWSY